MRRFFSRSSIYRGNRPWPWALPLWLNYITSPRSRQGRGLVVFSLTIYIFRHLCYNCLRHEGGTVNSERRWPCMLTIDNLCNILLVIIDAILLGMAIQSRK